MQAAYVALWKSVFVLALLLELPLVMLAARPATRARAAETDERRVAADTDERRVAAETDERRVAAGTRLRAGVASLIGNAITHPALWFLWPRFLSRNFALLAGETCAIVVEGALLASLGGQGLRRGYALAAAVNLYSWLVGWLVTDVVGRRLVAFWFGLPHS